MPDNKIPPPKSKAAKRQNTTPSLKDQDRTGIITAVKTPLGFFALTVLAAETIIGLTISTSGLNEDHKFWLISGMLGLLLLMIVVVGMLAWKSRGSLSPEMGQIELEAQRLANEANRQSLQAKQQSMQALTLSQQNASLIEDAGFIEAIRVALMADPAFHKGTAQIAQAEYRRLEEKQTTLPKSNQELRE